MQGLLTPRQLAAEIDARFGHQLPLAERLASLDDEYDLGAYATTTAAEIDEEVMALARQLASDEHRSAAGD